MKQNTKRLTHKKQRLGQGQHIAWVKGFELFNL